MLAIVHSAVAAWLSTASRSRSDAVLVGILSHGVLDFIGHEEPFDEHGRARPAMLLPDVALTVPTVLWLGTRRGWLSPDFLGSLAAILPDAEHFLSPSCGSRRCWFPFHRFESLLHSKTRPKLSAKGQFLLGGLLWLLLVFWRRDVLRRADSTMARPRA
jgi:hypothetical protein